MVESAIYKWTEPWNIKGRFQNRKVCGQAFPLLPSPSPFHLFFGPALTFRAITRLETLATHAKRESQAGSLSFNGNAEFSPRFCRWLHKGLQRLVTFNSVSVEMRLEERSQMESRTIVCYLGGICRRLEPLERIYGRFPSVDPERRFATVANLGKPLYRENRLLKNP